MWIVGIFFGVDQCLLSPVRIEKYYPHPHSWCWLSLNDELDGCSLALDTKAHALGAVLGAITKNISEPVTQVDIRQLRHGKG
jgi:hypothetical protein